MSDEITVREASPLRLGLPFCMIRLMVQVVYDKPVYWFVFCKDELLLQRETEGRCTVPYGAEPPVKLAEWNTVHRLTPLEGRDGKYRHAGGWRRTLCHDRTSGIV